MSLFHIYFKNNKEYTIKGHRISSNRIFDTYMDYRGRIYSIKNKDIVGLVEINKGE